MSRASCGTQPLILLDEAKAYLRIDHDEEEASLAGMVRSASELCERFVGQVLVRRPYENRLVLGTEWQKLETTPIHSIERVAKLGVDGSEFALSMIDYHVDIDADGGGWVRLALGANLSRVAVSGTGGAFADRNAVPEPLRHGVLRMVAHLFDCRDQSAEEPPASVTALWRPYRKMRLA